MKPHLRRVANSLSAYAAILSLLAWEVDYAAAHEQTRRAADRILLAQQADADRATEAVKKLRERGECDLTIQVLDDGGSEPLPALVRVIAVDGETALPLNGEIHRANQWHSLDAAAVVKVPRTKIRVEALRGLATTLARQEIDVSQVAEAAVKLKLQRFYDPGFRGLRAGNTHLHLMKITHEEALRYLQLTPQTDELDIVFLSHLRRIPDERHYISNRIVEESFAGGSLERLSQDGVLFGNGQEHRHNFGPQGEGYGHVMLLDIQRLVAPISIGPGIMRQGTDGIPLQRGIRTAREDGATIVWCHNTFGHEDIPNWLAGHVHAQNIFDGGEHGGYEDTFYRYLNLGLRVPFSTGTDWFIYDFSRVYVPLYDELTKESWLTALREGRSFITNGPFLELEAERGTLGDTISIPGPNEITFVGRGLGRQNFKALELIYNGRVVQRVETTADQGYYVADLRFGVEVTEPGWIALRIPHDAGQSELGKPLFAHTSPVYVEVANKSAFSLDVAEQLKAEIETGMKAIESQGRFAKAAERNNVLKVHRAAIQELEEMIKRKGVSPTPVR